MEKLHDLAPVYTEKQFREWGFVFWLQLPNGDWAGVTEMSFGKGRLCIDIHPFGYEQGYCYEAVGAAIASLATWNPVTEDEPLGWFRHINSGRRRTDGDPSKEYIQR